MKKFRLSIKFAILFIVIMALMSMAYFAWDSNSEQKQAEDEMLEKAQILSREMDAMWKFFEVNQHNFAKDDQGNYTLYCVIAAKSVSKFFTSDTDYVIHYTNSTTRRPADAPDDFEQRALQLMHDDRSITEYYEMTTDSDGKPVFRYIKPLYVTESCLECHGEPKGELDPYGFPKEGQKIGDIAGAISITMPLDLYMKGIDQNIAQNAAFSIIIIIAGFSIITLGIFYLVTRPLKKFGIVAEQMGSGDLDVSFKDIGFRDEISDLAANFDAMTQQLKMLYDDLEDQVEMRTQELADANDILEQQRLRLEEANGILAENNRFKSDFLAIMSHELRTPLTSILAFTEMWESSHEDADDSERSAMQEIRTNGQILLHMVNNILEMARAEAGKLELKLEPVDLVDLTNLVERTLLYLAERRNIDFSTTVDKDVPIICADWEKVRRIIENLTSNAIKFTKKGGKVSIHVSRDPDSEFIIISVQDTGIGIEMKDMEHIFDKFTQSDKSSMRRYSGSGLGLAVVKELVEVQNGMIEIDSVYKQGTTITVRIPMVEMNWRELQ